ncbi:hypothetical protein [Ruminococcus sp.]|uniref:hypothetical protein n=1 Tax=Ruminococcus sp. TaxID=41978 RepID=UPI0025F02330|nr:hypothetical protein [Ruminococcus sp.]
MKQIFAPDNTSGSKNTALKGAAETTSALRRLYIREGKQLSTAETLHCRPQEPICPDTDSAGSRASALKLHKSLPNMTLFNFITPKI